MPHLKDYVYSSRCPGLHSELTLTPCFLLECRCNGPLPNSIPGLWNQNRRIILHRLIVFVLFTEVIEAWWRIYAAVNLSSQVQTVACRLLWRQTIIEPLLAWSQLRPITWWRHQMETFSALLALCAGNSAVTVNSPQRPVTRNFDVFFDLRLNKRLNKQS